MNIIKNRYLYFLISLLVIVPGIIFMAIHWVNNPQEVRSRWALTFEAAPCSRSSFLGRFHPSTIYKLSIISINLPLVNP